MAAPPLPKLNDDRPGPLVSVVMPTHNRSRLLRESAGMVLGQTLHDLELIISDDGSSDDTPATVAEIMAKDARVRYRRAEGNEGITAAVNEGILRSRGEFIQICHDHDIYRPTLTARLADVLVRRPSVAFVHPGRQGCDHLGTPRLEAYFVCGYPEVSPGEDWLRFMLSRLASPVTALSMMRRSALERAGLFDPEFGACSDVEMWLRLCAVGDVGYVDELLLLVRGREPGHPYGGVNWAILDEVVRAHRKHLRRHYHGWRYAYWKGRREIGIDVSLLFDYLNSMRHHRWEDVHRGRRYLRRNGRLLSRLAAWVL